MVVVQKRQERTVRSLVALEDLQLSCVGGDSLTASEIPMLKQNMFLSHFLDRRRRQMGSGRDSVSVGIETWFPFPQRYTK